MLIILYLYRQSFDNLTTLPETVVLLGCYRWAWFQNRLVDVAMHRKLPYAPPPEAHSSCPNRPAVVSIEFHMPGRRIALRKITMDEGWGVLPFIPEQCDKLRKMLLRLFHHNTMRHDLSRVKLSTLVPSCESISPFLRVRSMNRCMCAMAPRQA